MQIKNIAKVVLLFTFVLTALSNAPKFDINSSVIQSNRQWTRVKIGVNGVDDNYQLIYDQYPKGWNQVLNYIYIPAEQRAINRKYPCKVRVRASDGSESKATVVFVNSDSNVYLSDLVFGYDETFDDGFFNSGVFQGRPELIASSIGPLPNIVIPVDSKFEQQQSVILKRLNSVSQVPGVGISGIIDEMPQSDNKVIMADVRASLKLRQALSSGNAGAFTGAAGLANGIQGAVNGMTVPTTITLNPDQKQFVLMSQIKKNMMSQKTQQKSIESIFFKLPGPQQLDAIITTADSFALIKTIQKVIQSELTCQQKSSYLSDFFGRIQSAISMKAFAATQLKVVIDGAQTEIDRLNKQIARNQQSMDKLGTKDLRDKLKKSLVQLQQLYNQFNQEQTKVVPKQANIDLLRKNIETIRSRSQNNRQELPVQKLQLNQVNSNIAKIQAQLKDAIAKRSIYETNINKLSQSISKYDEVIEKDQSSIEELENQISKKQNDAQELKSKYQTLQIQIERKRKQIAVREKRAAEIQAMIPNLQQRLLIEKRKLNNNQIDKLKGFVQNLQTILPNVTAQVDQINFKCNEVKQVETVKQDNSVSYIIRPKQFVVYIQTLYNIRYETTNIQTDTISLTPISILDRSWSSAFGSPYEEDSYAKTSQFNFNQDFGCLSPSSIVSSSGIIKDIGGRYIDIQQEDEEEPVRLNLGTCSRLQSVTELPKPGQRIYFKGQKIEDGGYNLYRGSCL